MKAKELKALLKDIDDETNIVIPIGGGGFPAIPCVHIRAACQGFDWDNGKLFLYPEITLYKVKK